MMRTKASIEAERDSVATARHAELLAAINDNAALVLKLDKRVRKVEKLLKEINEKPLGEANIQFKPDFKAAGEAVSNLINEFKAAQERSAQAQLGQQPPRGPRLQKAPAFIEGEAK